MSLCAIALAAVAIVLASAGVSATAQAQTGHDPAAASAKKSPAKKFVREPAPAMRIACPIGGCRPIPANCTTTMDQTWRGGTGYEIIHCP
jgi:hypothetical protein